MHIAHTSKVNERIFDRLATKGKYYEDIQGTNKGRADVDETVMGSLLAGTIL